MHVFAMENVARGTPAELRRVREDLRRGAADRDWGGGAEDKEEEGEDMDALRRAFVFIHGADVIAGKSDAALRHVVRVNRAIAANMATSMSTQTSPLAAPSSSPSSPIQLPLLAPPPPPPPPPQPATGDEEEAQPAVQQAPAGGMCVHCLGDFAGEAWLNAHLQFNLCPAPAVQPLPRLQPPPAGLPPAAGGGAPPGPLRALRGAVRGVGPRGGAPGVGRLRGAAGGPGPRASGAGGRGGAAVAAVGAGTAGGAAATAGRVCGGAAVRAGAVRDVPRGVCRGGGAHGAHAVTGVSGASESLTTAVTAAAAVVVVTQDGTFGCGRVGKL